MRYHIHYRPSAAKALRKLDRQTARRILNNVEKLAHNPRPAGCKKLQSGSGEMRIRVGNYRVVYDIYDDQLVILVLHVGHRREVYQ